MQAEVKRESKLKAAYIIDQANTKKLAEATASKFSVILKDVLGIAPNRITYTGTGFHCHYVVCAEDGWTPAGIETAKEVHSNLTDAEDLPEMRSNFELFRSNVELFNLISEKAKAIGLAVDNQVKDWGVVAK